MTQNAVYVKKWMETHKEKYAAIRKRYRETHKEEIAAYSKHYRETHKDQETYKERKKASNKRYQETHREKVAWNIYKRMEKGFSKKYNKREIKPCYLKEAKAMLDGKHWQGKNKCTKLPGDEQ